MVGLIR